MTRPPRARLLIVTAVIAERDAAAAALITAGSFIGPYSTLTATTPHGRVDLLAAGAGVAAAAAATGSALAAASYDLVLSVGVGGGFAPAQVGETVVASAVVHADLGAESEDGFLSADELGLAHTRTDLSPSLVRELAHRCSARTGTVLSISTVTGTAATAAELAHRHPDAVAEAMEGAGVLAAANAHRVLFGEIRTISNMVGPRDRSAWQLQPALAAITAAISAIVAQPLEVTTLL
ncbi:MAG: Futalosine hydrolase [Pseudonocardiales bacterium]|nr:Futalosine hydrolase [Pseudonocardiales bacterium]